MQLALAEPGQPPGIRLQRPLRTACRRRQATRQRLLRQRGQSRRAHHERRARRPDPRVARHGVAVARSPAARHRAARARPRSAARPERAGRGLPGRPSGPARRVPRASLARVDAQQSPARAHVVHRPRARARGGAPAASARPPADHFRHRRARQEPAVAAGRVRGARRLSGRRVVRRARARSPTRGSSRRRSRPSSAISDDAGQSRARRDHEVRARPAPAARARQLRARDAGVRGARAQDPESGAARHASSPPAASASASAGEQTFPLAPFAVPLREHARAGRARAFRERCACSSERALAARPDFAITTENARRRRGDLPAARRHSARARARRRARALDVRAEDRRAAHRPLQAPVQRRPHGACRASRRCAR